MRSLPPVRSQIKVGSQPSCQGVYIHKTLNVPRLATPLQHDACTTRRGRGGGVSNPRSGLTARHRVPFPGARRRPALARCAARTLPRDWSVLNNGRQGSTFLERGSRAGRGRAGRGLAPRDGVSGGAGGGPVGGPARCLC